MPDGMRLRSASERRAPARFGDPESPAAVNYVDYKVPELENLNSDFPHPVYQFDNQLAQECSFPTLPLSHPGPGPSGAILQEKRENGEVATLPRDQPTVFAAGTDNDEYQGEKVDENETEPEDQGEPQEKASLQPISRDQTTITGKPNPAIRNHDNRDLLAYTAPVEGWVAAANQHETRRKKDFNTLLSMTSKIDPELPASRLDPKNRRVDNFNIRNNEGGWTRTSSEYRLSVSPPPPGAPSPSPQGDPFVAAPQASNSTIPEVGVSQPRRPYTVHIDRDAAKKKAAELEGNKNRDFQLRQLGQKAPDWISLSDGVKYIITYEMTKAGMSFVQVIRTFRLTMSEAGELMNLVGEEQRKIDSFDDEVKKHLHTADLTWMDEYNERHTPLITDHMTAKEIRQAKAFLKFVGFEQIASKIGEYEGVGAGRRFPILLNHFWGDGFKDLPPHFAAFCSEELAKMVSSWNDTQKERPPPMSTLEMHVRFDPPTGTVNPMRLINNLGPATSAQNPPAQNSHAREPAVGDPSSRNPPAPVLSPPVSLGPGVYGLHLNGLPNLDKGYHTARQSQPVHPIQHGLPVFLPDPGYGVPINPFATLPPPSMPHNPTNSQYGAWQPYVPVQGPPHIPQWPHSHQRYNDRGMYWNGPLPRYRESTDTHFTTAMGEDYSPTQAPMIIRQPYPPPPVHYQQRPGINTAQPGPHRQFNLSPIFGHVPNRVPVSNHGETPHNAGLQPHPRPPGSMGNYPQQAANRGPGGNHSALNPRWSMSTAQSAHGYVAGRPTMSHVPQAQVASSRAGLDIASARELPRQNTTILSGRTVPLLNSAQLASLYDTYDLPRRSMGTPNHTVDHEARSTAMGQVSHSQGNPPNPVSSARYALEPARQTNHTGQGDVQMPDAQPEKAVSEGPLLNYPQEIQQRDPGLRKEVDAWINKYRDSWLSESESESEGEEEEEEILPPMPTRPTRAQRFQDNDDGDEDFVLQKDDEAQKKKKEKKVRVSLPAVSRKRAASAASASAGVRKRPGGARKKSADTAAPVAGPANKRKAAQTGESQADPKRRRVNDEAPTTRASSAAGRSMRRRSAPAASDVSDEEKHDDGRKSKPVKGRRQPGGIWGRADTLFTNGRGDYLTRSEVAALPNTKYRPGGSFGGGKWQEEDTGLMWLPVNPPDQCRKNSAEKELQNCAPAVEGIGAGEKKPKKNIKASQAVKKSVRLVSQQATPPPTKAGSSQAIQSSPTIRDSSPAIALETRSLEEFLSSKGLYTRGVFETDLLFRQYVSALGPPFSTHPEAVTLPPTPKGKSLNNYISPQAHAEHEVYLAAQKRTGGEGSQPQDEETREQVKEGTQEKSQEEKPEQEAQEGTQGAAQKTTGDAAKGIQEQAPEVKEAKKDDLPDLLKEQGLDLDDPPALDTTEHLGRHSTRLRSAALDLLSSRTPSSRSVSPTKETLTKKPATKESAAKGSAAKKTATKEDATTDTDAGAEEPASPSPFNFEAQDGVLTIRTLRPRKGKEVDHDTALTGPSEKK